MDAKTDKKLSFKDRELITVLLTNFKSLGGLTGQTALTFSLLDDKIKTILNDLPDCLPPEDKSQTTK